MYVIFTLSIKYKCFYCEIQIFSKKRKCTVDKKMEGNLNKVAHIFLGLGYGGCMSLKVLSSHDHLQLSHLGKIPQEIIHSNLT